LVDAGNGRARNLPPPPRSGEDGLHYPADRARQQRNIIEGLRAGADDYLVKPFHAEELQARILVGLRVMTLQETLVDRVKALQAAAFEIELLKLQIPL
jgi:DNA-binding response OmpR family regulator